MAQQPSSRYPFRNPLPTPVEEFLHASDAAAAWTAEIDGLPVGHVCRVGPPSGFPDAEEMNRVCATSHGCAVDQLAWVSAFFVGLDARGAGVGRALLRAVVDDMRAEGLRPCLEVLTAHAAPLALYESTGWREVMSIRPAWLRSATGGDGVAVRVMTLRELPASSPLTRVD